MVPLIAAAALVVAAGAGVVARFCWRGNRAKAQSGPAGAAASEAASPEPPPSPGERAAESGSASDGTRRRPRRRAPSPGPVSPEAAGRKLTTEKHLWLLDIPDGADITRDRIGAELGVPVRFGWHADRSLVLAIFAPPEALRPAAGGLRLNFQGSADYGTATLAGISGPAIPLFTATDEDAPAWTFRGFFRFQHPANQSVACQKLSALPQELEELKSQNAASTDSPD